MYEEKFGHAVAEEVVEQDGIELIFTRGSPPSISTLEQALDEIKSMYEEQFGDYVVEEWLRQTSPVSNEGATPLLMASQHRHADLAQLLGERELTLTSSLTTVQHLCLWHLSTDMQMSHNAFAERS